jgi:hypothetical protein
VNVFPEVSDEVPESVSEDVPEVVPDVHEASPSLSTSRVEESLMAGLLCVSPCCIPIQKGDNFSTEVHCESSEFDSLSGVPEESVLIDLQ